MPKIKTHSGAKKRFKVTKNGKIKRAHAFKSHILNKKTTKRKRGLRKAGYADKTNVKAIKPVSYTHLDVYKRQATAWKKSPCWKTIFFSGISAAPAGRSLSPGASLG